MILPFRAHEEMSICTKTKEARISCIRHRDLDMQTIFVDVFGNVTGILDWDGCLAVPRGVGYASFPEFLRRYWTSSF